MAKHDFSHLVLKPEIIARSLTLGYRVPDETWLAVVRRIEPRIFDSCQLLDLRWILDPTIERRGGKSIRALSDPLVSHLRYLDRQDLPDAFVEGLIERLENRKRYSHQDADRAYAKRWWRTDRDRLIVYFYDYIYDRISNDIQVIEHEVFTTIPVSEKGVTPGEKTLATLIDLLRKQTVYDPPSEATLLKIVSEARGRKRRPKK